MKPEIQMQELFSHLCASTGLYSKETFLSLFGCITRMLRDHRMTGFVMTRTLEDAAFETMVAALENRPHLPLFRCNQPDLFSPDDHDPDGAVGFLVVLTDRLCATLYWSAATHESFRMFEGGWSFHPGDTRTIAAQLVERLQTPELDRLLAETAVDRRYDDKLNLLITGLVHGLENRNRELTVALDQVKTLNKRNIDTERLAAVGQLSSVIAHEIRNPLGLIDLYAKLTEDQMAKLDQAVQKPGADGAGSADAGAAPDPAAMRTEWAAKKDLLLKNLSLIRQATGSLETILSELTSYSRPLQLNLQPLDIDALVADVCLFYAPKYEEKGVTLALPEAPGAADAEVLSLDGDKLRQALINLLKNALEASKAGTTVTVAIARRRNDPQLYIKVTDEGAGIDPAHRKKLFTPYFSTKGNGTGLGLAHSRKILQAHGGSVELLASTPGKGSTFALVLPRNQGAEAL